MQYDILVTKQLKNGYVARPMLMPELVVSGESETEVLERVQKAIAQATAQSRIVRITVPSSAETTDDPWFRFAGMWGDEAEWEQFDNDITALRHKIEEQTHNA